MSINKQGNSEKILGLVKVGEDKKVKVIKLGDKGDDIRKTKEEEHGN